MRMREEEILEPDLPIIDPHHHLWDRRHLLAALAPKHGFEHVIRLAPRYLLDELLGDMTSGHNVRGTVFVECSSMYRTDGPAHLRPVGETEFVNGIAAMSASGVYGDMRACAGIVGHADLLLGEAVTEVLEAHVQAGGGRFRGVRHGAAWDANPEVLGPLNRRFQGMMSDERFRRGFAQLAPLDLSFDAWLLEPQLPELIDLARAFPQTRIILDHVGTPLGIGAYAGRREERFEVWRENIRTLATCTNVVVKLGGLGMVFCGFPSVLSDPPAPSSQLADEWRPYMETCIEAFGADRCMFESNFPVDLVSCSYASLWNAFKIIAAGASADEKAALFSGTARRVYRLEGV